MRLIRVDIGGYRSLYDVSVEPGDLTVITGPNNSGKTNFVEALDFLAEAYRHGLDPAISRKGGIENIMHRRMGRTRKNLSFAVWAALDATELSFRLRETSPARLRNRRMYFQHSFIIEPLSQRIEAGFRVTGESVLVRAREDGPPFIELSREAERFDVKITDRSMGRNSWIKDFVLLDESYYKQVFSTIRPNSLILNTLFLPLESSFVRAMGNIRSYQLVPLEGRKPGVPTPDAVVDTHGSNLPALVSYMRANQPEIWAKVMDAMRRTIPDLTDIKTGFTQDRRLALQFVERGVRRPWSAEDISDGTVQALGMYTAIYDRRASLILIEEPENSVHPWILRNFIDACRDVGTRQIILTTHSPALLGYLNPREISVAWRREGRTNIAPLLLLDPTISSVWEEGQTSLFEILDSGVFPEAVPGGE